MKIKLHSSERKVPGGWEERTLFLELCWGLIFIQIIDVPNEADIVVLKAWGLGWWRTTRQWIVPWRVDRNAI